MIIYCAVEDDLSFAVATRLISDSFPEADIRSLNAAQGGNAILRTNIAKYLELSARQKVLLLTDLDAAECAPQLRRAWLNEMPLPENFTFRIAVKEVEAWLLADRAGFAALLGISDNAIPNNIEDEQNPKATLLRLTRGARSSSVKTSLLPKSGVRAMIGLGYNSVLSEFVRTKWNIASARENSPSLESAYRRISAIRP